MITTNLNACNLLKHKFIKFFKKKKQNKTLWTLLEITRVPTLKSDALKENNLDIIFTFWCELNFKVTKQSSV